MEGAEAEIGEGHLAMVSLRDLITHHCVLSLFFLSHRHMIS